MFGTSAKWLSVIEEKNQKPKETHKLEKLKIIYSTGSPLKPNSFDYVYSSVKENVILGSITGGSDIISLFCGHNFNLPVYRGEIQCMNFS
jgi:acetoacetyl-CoA synthetase